MTTRTTSPRDRDEIAGIVHRLSGAATFLHAAGGAVSGTAANMLTMLVVAQTQDITSVAAYFQLVIVSSVFGQLCDFGLARLVLHDVAALPTNEDVSGYVSRLVAPLAITSMTAFTSAAVALSILAETPSWNLLISTGLVAGVIPVSLAVQAIARARRRDTLASCLGLSAPAVLTAIAVVLNAFLGWGVRVSTLTAATYLTAALLSSFLVLRALPRTASRHAHRGDTRARSTLRRASPFGGNQLLYVLARQGDVLLASTLIDARQFSSYLIAARVSAAFAILGQAAAQVNASYLSRRGGLLELQAGHRLWIYGVAAGVSVVAAPVLILARDPILGTLFGEALVPTAGILGCLLAAQVFSLATGPNGLLLGAAGLGDRALRCSIEAFLMSTVLSISLLLAGAELWALVAFNASWIAGQNGLGMWRVWRSLRMRSDLPGLRWFWAGRPQSWEIA